MTQILSSLFYISSMRKTSEEFNTRHHKAAVLVQESEDHGRASDARPYPYAGEHTTEDERIEIVRV